MKADLIHQTDPQGNNPVFSLARLSHTGRYWPLSVFHWQNLCLFVCGLGSFSLFFIMLS